jgi:hypothetical protein
MQGGAFWKYRDVSHWSVVSTFTTSREEIIREGNFLVGYLRRQIADLRHSDCSGGDFDPCRCITKTAEFYGELRRADALEHLIALIESYIASVREGVALYESLMACEIDVL